MMSHHHRKAAELSSQIHPKNLLRNHMPLQWTFLLTIGLLFFSGCSGSRVSEVSVEASGVEIRGETPKFNEIDWPGWRGGTNDGMVPFGQKLITNWSETENVLWSIDIPGRGNSSPIIVGETVYLATAEDDKEEQWVLAYDAKTGEEKWSTMVRQGGFPTTRQMHPKSTHANGTVACDGENLFVAFLGNNVITAYALDLEGKKVWEKEVGDFSSKFGYAPSLQIYRSAVLVSADHLGGGYLAALDRETGQIAWRIPRPAKSSYSTARVVTVAGEDQLVISGCGTVSSYDPMTGLQKWTTDGTANATCGTVVANKMHIFASGGFPESQTVCITADGSRDVVWSRRVKVYEPSLLLKDDLLFGITDKGIAYCWSASDGKELWKTRLQGTFSASPIHCNENIYVPNNDGVTFVFKAVGESYQQIAANPLGDEAYASLAVSQSKIFARVVDTSEGRHEKLYCLGTPTEETSP